MESIQEFVLANLNYIYLGISLGIIFLLFNSLTRRKYRPLFHSLFFLCTAFIVTFLINDIFIIILLPFFILFILNIFNDRIFQDLVTIEENQIFESRNPLVWEQFDTPPELKQGGKS
ncbi:MAG: hypothetical protein DRO88_01955 [Promethearchaeia archaeon]|nr:MAG: hypothetical protein DRO88_01955 [Candidatus Lokiarchaeia archaeon]